MALYPQRARQPFGAVVQAELSRPECQRVDIAVAWVRASGLLHLERPLLDALARGGTVRIVVGIDGDNTSEEGLRGLLAIAGAAQGGNCSLFVRHNEAGPIFHPKMYAFKSNAECRIFVGSNNLTQAGLFQNEELSLLQTAALGSALDRDLDAFMDRLTDPADALVRPLDLALLDQLVAEGYVQKEAFLRGTLAAKRRAGRIRNPLFGSRPVRAPAPPAQPGPVSAAGLEPVGPPVSQDWQVVYLRLRLARGQQGQIPIPVVREMRRRIGATPSDGTVELRSRADGTLKEIRPAGATRAGDNVNTYKFEAARVAGETLLRIYLVGNQYFFEFLGGDDVLGAPVLAHLREGFEADPPRTFSTRPDLDAGTWYRFD